MFYYQKKTLTSIGANFFACFHLFTTKNIENAYFDQRLECAAPKCWLKYTNRFVTKRKVNKRKERYNQRNKQRKSTNHSFVDLQLKLLFTP